MKFAAWSAALCAIVSAAFLVPVAVGANRRLMVQLEPALTLPAQVSVLLNSLLFTPVLAKLVMVKIAPPCSPLSQHLEHWCCQPVDSRRLRATQRG